MGEEKGKAYLRELAKQNIAGLPGSAREVLDQAIAGEYAIALQIFNHHAVISAKKGAPVDWIKMEPATETLSVVSVHKSAPHPNAAKLLVDFITSKEGQEVFRDVRLCPGAPPGAGAGADPEAGRGQIPRPLLLARADRRQHAALEAGLGRDFQVRPDAPTQRRDDVI